MTKTPDANLPGSEFLGTWKITEGSMGSDNPEFAIVEQGETQDLFELYSQIGKLEPVHCQTLQYDAERKALFNLVGDRERCIAFWHRKARKPDSNNSIFAKRIAQEDDGFPGNPLLPWERRKGGGGGTWGAEDG